MDIQTPARMHQCAVLVIAHIALMATPLHAAEGTRRDFDIPAGAAVAQLNQWAGQAGVALIGDFEKISGLRTRAVKGKHTPEGALRVMTRGTGIACKYTRPRLMWCSLALPARPAPEPPPAADRTEPTQPTVLVTGTHIRGVSPTGARRLSFGQEGIAMTGLATVADVVRTLPQNFDGGPTEDTVLIGRETRTNAGRGTALNLRGLGPAETLVLMNGRRLAPGGTEGAFTDIASIPLIAVQRIDVLPDSGSALYGSDAIGGVVDVVFDRTSTGFETQAKGGLATQGGPVEVQVGQRFGLSGAEGNLLLAAEYHERGRLPASSRTRARSDLRRFGGDNFDLPQSNPGTVFAGGGIWAIPSGQDGTALEAADLLPGTLNLSDRFGPGDVNPRQRRISALASAQHSLTEGIQVWADALLSRREVDQRTSGVRANLPVTSTNPFYVNPTGGTEPIVVAYDFTKDFGPAENHVEITTSNVALGGSIELPRTWRLSAYASRAQEDTSNVVHNQISYSALISALQETDPARAFNPFGDGSHTSAGTLERIRSTGSFSARSTLDTVNGAVDGPLAQLPGGAMKLALGAEYRHQAFESRLSSVDIISSTPSLGRDVHAAYAELLLPLAQGQKGLRQLELSLATRYEDHVGISRTTAPKAGLTWSPVEDLTVTGTWTRAFRAPNLADLYEGQNTSIIGVLPDPRSPTMFSNVLIWREKNADLLPESSQSWSLGIELGPQRLAGWSLAATYFDIHLRNKYTDYRFDLQTLLDPADAHRVIRAPTAEQRANVCARSMFVGPAGGCESLPIDAIIDARVLNGASLATNGIDLTVRRAFESWAGRFDIDLNGAYVLRYAMRESPTAPVLERVDTQNSVLRLRSRGSVNWQRGPLGATAFLNFDGAYRDIISRPQRHVDSLATWDLQLRYDLRLRAQGAAADSRIALSVQNLFDTDPPFLNNSIGFGYDAENGDLLGRVTSLQLTTRW